MAINLAAISKQLYPGLMHVSGKYKDVFLELDKVYTKKQSFMNQEFVLQARYTGMAAQKKDGQAVTYDNMSGDRYTYAMQPIGAGIGTVWTRQALADGLYKDAFSPTNIGLQNSMRSFWNVQSASVFNLAATYNNAVGGDGKALLDTAHPVDGGSFPNTTSIPQSLNEGSLVAAIKAIPQTFVDQAGLFIDVKAEKLLIPWNLRDVALRLLEADLRPSSAENDPNIIHRLHGGISDLITCRYLTSPYAWFLLTDVDGFMDIQREPYEMDMFCDFDTDSLKIKNYERRGFFNCDPRAVYGQLATA